MNHWQFKHQVMGFDKATGIHVLWVRAGDIGIDEATYQRSRRPKKVKKLVDGWRWPSYELVKIAIRADGLPYATNGGHRRDAVIKLYGEDYMLLCQADEAVSLAEEARTFIDDNDPSQALAHFIRFRGRLHAKDDADVASDIEAIVNQEGFSIPSDDAKTYDWKTLYCTACLEGIYKSSGRDGLSLVLHTVMKLWPSDKGALQAHSLSSLALFFRCYSKHPDFDYDRVLTRWRRYSNFGQIVDLSHNYPRENGLILKSIARLAWGLLRAYNCGNRTYLFPEG